ncbi:MAG: GTP pyrophosphokinase family protein [Bacteroidales bacterium]
MLIRSFEKNEYLFLSAARGVAAKLYNLNDEFKYKRARNPIHQIITRVKTPQSIINKLRKRGYELSIESARENLSDIAGVRVICSYIDDIYLIADLLTAQDDIEIIRVSDYIKDPKQNGYRSLHLIVTIPVFLSNENEYVKVEIQIRTIAMDFWASLEHELAYKVSDGKNEDISRELKACADIIATTDMRLQRLHNLTINSKSKKS